MPKTPAGAERDTFRPSAPNRLGTPAGAERFYGRKGTPAKAERRGGVFDGKHEREYIRRKFTGRR